MPGKLRKLLLPLGVVLAAALVAIAMVGSREEFATGDAAEVLPLVQAVEVTLGEVPVSVIAHGTVSSRYELELASEVTGRVIWVAPEFQPGQIVAADTVLLRIDPVNYRLALAEAEAALATANMALADATALKRKAAIGEAELNIAAARERIIKAEQDLAYTEIKAPFDAVIDQQLVEFGQFIATGRPVARLLSSALAEVRLPLTPADAGLLAASPAANVVLSARVGDHEQQWRGRVARIESRVEQQSRVIPVVVEVESPYDPLKHAQPLPLGLFVTAALPGRPIGDAVRLPSAVMHAGDTVFVLADGALQRRPVDVALREGDTVVINGGLRTGDQVVTTRLELMFEGMKVELGDA
jgi:RND family efflux transporter MFP subunit